MTTCRLCGNPLARQFLALATILTIVTMASSVVASSKKPNCSDFSNIPEVTGLAQTMETVSSAPAYPNTQMENWNVVFLDSNRFPECAVLITNQSTRAFSFTQASQFQFPFRAFYMGDDDYSGSFRSALAQEHIEHAFIMELNQMRFVSNSWLNARAFQDWSKLISWISLHELFHAYRYMNISEWGLEAWPYDKLKMDNPNGGDRNEIYVNCYTSSSQVKQLTKDEVNLLTQAWLTGQRQESLDLIREFILKRNQRYLLVRDIEVDEETNYCPNAEMGSELLEGSANYFAFASMLQAGVMNEEDVREYIQISLKASLETNDPIKNEPFYETGMLQLFLLRKILGTEGLNTVSSAIDMGETSIFDQVQKLLSEQSNR